MTSDHLGVSESDVGIIGYRGNEKGRAKWYNHQPAMEIKRLLGDDVWNQYFKFCTVRHPLDKLVSAYFFQRKKMLEADWKFKMRNTLRKHLLKRPDFYPNSSGDQILSFRNWLKAGAFWDDKPAFMIDGEFALNGFIRFEHMEEDLEEICKKLRLPFEHGRLKHLKGNRRDTHFETREFFNEGLIKRVRELYAFELDFFGYEI